MRPAAESADSPRKSGFFSPREGRGGDLAFTLAAFVLSLLPRLYVAIAWAREPVWDGHYYDFGARRIAAGLGYSDDVIIGGVPVWHPWCHYPVGYSAFLGIVYRIFGGGPQVATIANAIMGALLVAAAHRLARYGTTPIRARIAAILTALSPGLIVYSALLMTEPLAALGLVATAWLFVREMGTSAAQKPLRGALAAGALLGLTTLVRPQSLLVAPALVLLASPKGSLAPLRARLLAAAKPSAIALFTALAVVAPWTARNCRVMDGCALVSTNAGWNLAIGASPRATGRFEGLKASDGCPVVTGQVQQDRCWMDEGMRWIRKDPIRWIGLMPQKLSFTFDHESFPMGYLGEADQRAWPEPLRALGRGVLSTVHRALLAAAVLGVIAWPLRGARRRDRVIQAALLILAVTLGARGLLDDMHPAWPLAVLLPLVAALRLPGSPDTGHVIGYLAWAVATVVLTHAVFFGEDRYHMVVTPILCILAASALRLPRSTTRPTS